MVRIIHALLIGFIAVCIASTVGFIGGWRMSNELHKTSMQGLSSISISTSNAPPSFSETNTNTRTNSLNGQADSQDIKEQFAIFWDVWNLVHREFYRTRPLDQRKMIYGSITGMLQSLGDEYTGFQEPVAAERTREAIRGSFEGIGALLQFKDGKAIVVRPLRKSPALKAGLKADDVILKVDGEEVVSLVKDFDEAKALDKIVQKIRGTRGTSVTLTISRTIEERIFDIEIIRDRVPLISVNYQMLPDQVAHIQITEFKDTTPHELEEALQELLPQKPVGIVLDLRHNPGGVLPASLKVLGYFYDGTAMYEKNSQGERKELEAQVAPEEYRVFDLPMVVLIDERSASASEIVAGALHDRRPNTTLLGKKSYGKGSVQNVHELRDGSSVRITVAQWFTPDMHEIHKVGIAPDYVVEPSQDGQFAMPCVGDQMPPQGQQSCNDGQLTWAVWFLTKHETPPTPTAVPMPSAQPTAVP